jgi:starch phosphorylase
VGWVIGSGEAYENVQEQDTVESGALYDILEREIVPLFYDREKDGLPRRWIAKVKRSMSHLGAYFNTHRMTSDYVRDYYLDAGKYFEALAGDGQARAKELASWRARLERSWGGIRVEDVKSNADKTLTVGDRIEAQALVRLGDLKPEDVEVQLCVGGFEGGEYIKDSLCGRMVADKEPKDGIYTYRANMPCTRSGRRAFAIRVIPHHEDLVHPFVPGKVIWA